MKEKLLQSYENMKRRMKKEGWDVNLGILNREISVSYGKHTFNLQAGTTIPKGILGEELAKILYMDGKVTEAWLQGVITLKELDEIIEKIYEGEQI